MKYFPIFDKNGETIFRLQCNIGNISTFNGFTSEWPLGKIAVTRKVYNAYNASPYFFSTFSTLTFQFTAQHSLTFSLPNRSRMPPVSVSESDKSIYFILPSYCKSFVSLFRKYVRSTQHSQISKLRKSHRKTRILQVVPERT